MKRYLVLFFVLFFLFCGVEIQEASASGNACATTSTGTNWSSAAHWTSCGGGVPGNGDTAAIGNTTVVDVNEIVGTSPASAGTNALTINASLTVSSGVTLTLRGPVSQGAAPVVLSAGSNLLFDASLAASPSTTTYEWFSGNWVQNATMITCNGTSGSHVTISTAVGSGHAYFSGNSGIYMSCTYGDFIRIGDSVNTGVNFNSPWSGSPLPVLHNVTFDADSGAVTVGTNVDIEDSYFLQTNAKLQGSGNRNPFFEGDNNATVGGKIYRSVFIAPPKLSGNLMDLEDNYFGSGFEATNPWFKMSGGLIRIPGSGGFGITGDISNAFVLFDNGSVPLVTGTATGSQSSVTLQDTSKSWTVNNYSTVPSSAVYSVEITGGRGAGQRRMISNNTSNTLTIAYRWDITPDSTSTYSIINDILNNHGLMPGAASTLDGLVWQSAGTDAQGDCFLHLPNGVTSKMVLQLHHSLLIRVLLLRNIIHGLLEVSQFQFLSRLVVVMLIQLLLLRVISHGCLHHHVLTLVKAERLDHI